MATSPRSLAPPEKREAALSFHDTCKDASYGQAAPLACDSPFPIKKCSAGTAFRAVNFTESHSHTGRSTLVRASSKRVLLPGYDHRWGGNHLDIAHWGVNMELTYPRKIRLMVLDELQNGISFIGEQGWTFVCRPECAPVGAMRLAKNQA